MTATASQQLLPIVHSSQEAIETYIRAKDENRPYLMERAFAQNATLEMVVTSGTISFPPVSNGLHAISDVLVRQFAQTYENVRTLCLSPPPQNDQIHFSCSWLVGMSEKESRKVRVGCGQYDWLFQSRSPRLVERLTITIQVMESLPSTCVGPVMNWLSQLPYPWCTAEAASSGMPIVEELKPIHRHLARASA